MKKQLRGGRINRVNPLIQQIISNEFLRNSEPTVTIGKKTFSLFTDTGHAFAHDKKSDIALIKAMIRGSTMIIKGVSSRRTKTTDTYSLKGVSAAMKAINKACKNK